MVTLAPAYVLAFNQRFKSSFSLARTIMDVEPITTVSPDLEHPDDAQYIWLPILVLVGVVLFAGLVKFILILLSLAICTTAFSLFAYAIQPTT